MASFREHLGFSSALGVGYGLLAHFGWEFSPTEATLAGYITALGGMLPDLDTPTGRPGREIFSLAAAVLPLMMIGHVLRWTGFLPETETVILLLLGMYFLIRYGLAWMIAKLSSHRGMFHSIPTMFIAAEMMYLAYPSDRTYLKGLMGGGIAVGFFSHLLLDEVYALEMKGLVPKFKKSFGTAIKLVSTNFGATAFTYGVFAFLTYLMFQDAGLIEVTQAAMRVRPEQSPASATEQPPEMADAHPSPTGEAPNEVLPTRTLQQATLPDELTDAPPFQ